MATSNIFAGSETTAISLRAVLYYLLKNPTCKQKLSDEINGLKSKENVGNTISLDQAKRMPYLQGRVCLGEKKHGDAVENFLHVLTRAL